jgi:hypothetical protein
MGPQKRKVSSRITDDNFVGAESNVVTKCLKESAAAAQAAAVKRRQRQPSVEDVEEEDDAPRNNTPKNPEALLEAANGSDDIGPLDNDPVPGSKGSDDDDDEPQLVTKHVETAEEQHRESNKL